MSFTVADITLGFTFFKFNYSYILRIMSLKHYLQH